MKWCLSLFTTEEQWPNAEQSEEVTYKKANLKESFCEKISSQRKVASLLWK